MKNNVVKIKVQHITLVVGVNECLICIVSYTPGGLRALDLPIDSWQRGVSDPDSV